MLPSAAWTRFIAAPNRETVVNTSIIASIWQTSIDKVCSRGPDESAATERDEEEQPDDAGAVDEAVVDETFMGFLSGKSRIKWLPNEKSRHRGEAVSALQGEQLVSTSQLDPHRNSGSIIKEISRRTTHAHTPNVRRRSASSVVRIGMGAESVIKSSCEIRSVRSWVRRTIAD